MLANPSVAPNSDLYNPKGWEPLDHRQMRCTRALPFSLSDPSTFLPLEIIELPAVFQAFSKD